MSAKAKADPQEVKAWLKARRRHRLSHEHVQMAGEIGLNPKKLSKIDNHDQEPWKLPLPAFIEQLYVKRFGREWPEVVMSIEERVEAAETRRMERERITAERREQENARRAHEAAIARKKHLESLASHEEQA